MARCISIAGIGLGFRSRACRRHSVCSTPRSPRAPPRPEFGLVSHDFSPGSNAGGFCDCPQNPKKGGWSANLERRGRSGPPMGVYSEFGNKALIPSIKKKPFRTRGKAPLDYTEAYFASNKLFRTKRTLRFKSALTRGKPVGSIISPMFVILL